MIKELKAVSKYTYQSPGSSTLNDHFSELKRGEINGVVIDTETRRWSRAMGNNENALKHRISAGIKVGHNLLRP